MLVRRLRLQALRVAVARSGVRALPSPATAATARDQRAVSTATCVRRAGARVLPAGGVRNATRCTPYAAAVAPAPARHLSTDSAAATDANTDADTDSADAAAGDTTAPQQRLAASPYLAPPSNYASTLNGGCWLAARALAAKHEVTLKRLQSNRGDVPRAELSRLHKDMTFLGPAIDCLHSVVARRKELQQLDALLADCAKDATMKELIGDAKAERDAAVKALLELEADLLNHLLPRNADDHRNAILEVRAGTGGDEASLFAGDIFRMYERFCNAKGWRFELLHSNRNDYGIKEASAMISGVNVFAALRHEIGVHRVQRIPATEAAGRIHTSTMTVAIMPEAADVDVSVDERDLRIDTYRAGGNGGQHVNKTESAVRITHLPTGVVVAIQDERSQHSNKAKAMKLLRARLFERKRAEEAERSAGLRKSQVSSAERSDRIRTYNFPQGRVTDHRIGLTKHDITAMMDGDLLDDFHEALVAAERREAMIQLGFASANSTAAA